MIVMSFEEEGRNGQRTGMGIPWDLCGFHAKNHAFGVLVPAYVPPAPQVVMQQARQGSRVGVAQNNVHCTPFPPTRYRSQIQQARHDTGKSFSISPGVYSKV